MMLGLYDTDDNLWMGNEEGPLLYEEEDLARVSAMICDRALHQRMGRTRAREFDGRTVICRDSKALLETPTEALRKLEEGY